MVGAVIAQVLLGPLANIGGMSQWLNHVMEIFAGFMLCGFGTTLLVPETKRRTLEQLAATYHGDKDVDDGNNHGGDETRLTTA